LGIKVRRGVLKKSKIKKIAPLAVTAAAMFLPLFLKNDYYMLVLNRLLINIVVVLGLNFITGLTGQMNLGTAGIFALGAYSSALVSIKFGVSPWIGMIVAICMGVVIGLGLGYPSLRVKGVYLSLTTIGFAEVVRLMLSNMKNFTGGTQGMRNIPVFSIFDFKFNTHVRVFYLFLFITVIAFFIACRITYSKWGRVFKSLRDNAEAVEMSGVNIASIKIKAFTLAAIFGSLAGSMYAHYMGYMNPSTFNTDFSANYVIMLMVGGIGSVYGNVIGALVVTILPEVLRFMGTYYQIVFSAIILLGAIFLPNGWGSGIRSLFRVIVSDSRKEGADG